MTRLLYVRVVFLSVIVVWSGSGSFAGQSQLDKARARIDDLRFEVYATSRQVEAARNRQATRRRAWSVIRRMGITKVYVEVYRSGHVVSGIAPQVRA